MALKIALIIGLLGLAPLAPGQEVFSPSQLQEMKERNERRKAWEKELYEKRNWEERKRMLLRGEKNREISKDGESKEKPKAPPSKSSTSPPNLSKEEVRRDGRNILIAGVFICFVLFAWIVYFIIIPTMKIVWLAVKNIKLLLLIIKGVKKLRSSRKKKKVNPPIQALSITDPLKEIGWIDGKMLDPEKPHLEEYSRRAGKVEFPIWVVAPKGSGDKFPATVRMRPGLDPEVLLDGKTDWVTWGERRKSALK